MPRAPCALAMTGFLHGVQYGGTMWASSPTKFLVGADDPVRLAVGLFSLSLLLFSRFCGILRMFNLTLKEFSPWKP